MKNRNSHSKFFFNISLIAFAATMALTASVMAGCGSDDKSASKETEIVHETEVVTHVVNDVVVDEKGNVLDKQGETTGETVSAEELKKVMKQTSGSGSDSGSSQQQSSQTSKKDSGGQTVKSGGSQSKKESSGSAQSSSGSKNSSKSNSSNSSKSNSSASKSSSANNNSGNNNNGNSNNNNNNNNTNNNNNNDNNNILPADNNSSSDVLKLAGKRYNKGDVVVCTYSILNASEKLINFQGYIKYDSKYLKVRSANLENSAGNSGLLNYNLDQEIRFNGSNLSGFNYTKEKPFLTVEYEVIKGGTTTPKFVWEVITGLSDKKYCDDNGNLINGFKCTHRYEKAE